MSEGYRFNEIGEIGITRSNVTRGTDLVVLAEDALERCLRSIIDLTDKNNVCILPLDTYS